MITMQEARRRSTHRMGTETDKTPTQSSKIYGPPISGLVTGQALVSQDGASMVDVENFWPTSTTIEPRGGLVRQSTYASEAVGALMNYDSPAGSYLFVAKSDLVGATWNIAPVGVGTGAGNPTVSGLTSGAFSWQENQTQGGYFLTIANGSDNVLIFDGTTFQSVTDVSAPFAITDVDTSLLSYVWNYRSRQFFIEKNTLSAWYLNVNAIAGQAFELPLLGVFNKGGSLIFGGTISSDSGDGMDDRVVFFTDQGEFAVYSGDNPGDPNDWGLDGVYDIGEPLGPRAFISISGDMIVATKAGLIPLSAAMNKSPEQIKEYAVSRPISATWENEVLLNGAVKSWRVEKWQSRNMVIVTLPPTSDTSDRCYLVNTETGAWTKYTGWPIADLAVFEDQLYISSKVSGSTESYVYRADQSGTDDGNLFVCRCCFAFDHLGQPTSEKTAHVMRLTWKAPIAVNGQVSVGVDYQTNYPTAPIAAPEAVTSGAAWDVTAWDSAPWGEDQQQDRIQTTWDAVSGEGQVLAPQIQITSDGASKLRAELVSVDLTYSTGATVAG